MRYVPNSSPATQERMLNALGLKGLDDLFTQVPGDIRQKKELSLLEPYSEPALISHIKKLSDDTANVTDYVSFLGAGAYYHYIPAAINHILLRPEFFTAYTPYQPEISQGTLQAMFEYQTLICELTGMEAANASMYDGASSLAEAILMAMRVTKRKKALISRAVHPEWRQAAQTYIYEGGRSLVEVPYSPEGTTDLGQTLPLLDETVAALAVQSPNFFGCLEDLKTLAEAAHQAGALFITAIAEPISLGIIKPPGELGADIVAGEGQSLGIPLSFGGPHLGIFAVKKEYLRSMPGRIVGETADVHGKRGYVLTLSTREQHIRREEATSNICTNHGLCALAATVYLSLLGKEGLRELALMNLSKAHYAKEAARARPGVKIKFSGPTFNEFVLEPSSKPQEVQARLAEERIWAGLDLARFYPELGGCLLLCFTEMVSKSDIDRLISAL